MKLDLISQNLKKKLKTGFTKVGNEKQENVKKSREWRERYTPSRLRKKRKLSRKEWMVLIIPSLAAVLAIVIVLFITNRSASYTFEESGKQYYGGSSSAVPARSELKIDQDGKVQLKINGTSSEVSLPIYMDNSQKIVLPYDVLYYSPRFQKANLVAKLSEVECKNNGSVRVARRGKGVLADSGFLYDGDDFYIFLEPMILYFNNYKMEVPALSYVEAVYGNQIMVFNYETKEVFMEKSDGSGIATPVQEDYTISLIGDSMTLPNGTKMLLGTRPDLYDPLS